MDDENRRLLSESAPSAPPMMPPLYNSLVARGSYGDVGRSHSPSPLVRDSGLVWQRRDTRR